MHIFDKLIITSYVKMDVMAEQLFWAALECTGVPNKVATERIMLNLKK